MSLKHNIILAIIVGILATFYSKYLILQDFTIYWKATENFVNKIDPYDLPNQNTYIEGQVGGINKSDFILKMWGPPTVFGVTFPFGYLNQHNAKKLYVFLLFSLLTFFTLFFERKYLSENSITLKPIYQAILYSPIIFFAMEIIRSGGVSWIALIGISTSILLFERKLFYLGSLALYPTLVKTQTLLLFVYLLLLVALRDKRYGIIFGLISIVLINTILVAFINLESFNNYFGLDTSSLGGGFIFTTASLGKVVNLFLHKQSLIVSYLPLVLGLAIFPYIVFKRSKNLTLIELILTLMPICMLFSPYIWIHDYIVCLPSIFYFAYQIKNEKIVNKYNVYMKILFVSYLLFSFPNLRYLVADFTQCDITSEIILALFSGVFLCAKSASQSKVHTRQ